MQINFSDKELACATTGIPINYRCQEDHTPKKLFLEYPPPLPHYIPAKTCVSGHHGNRGPCYLYHHGNILPPTNGCITYAPIPVSPRFNGMCFCLFCQQRAASLSCNCQSCLSLRFEQTAASVLRPHDKELSIKSPACCNGLTCKSMPAMQPQYTQFCHCLECVRKFSKDSRLKTHVEVIVNNQEKVDQTERHPHKDKDHNNNVSRNDEQEKRDNKTDGIETQCNKDMSPRVNNLTNNEQENPSSKESHHKKRKHEDDVLFVSKNIKTEVVGGICKLDNENHVVEIVREDRFSGEKHDKDLSTENDGEEQWGNESSGKRTEHYENNVDSDPSTTSSPEDYYNDGFDYKDSRKFIKVNEPNSSDSQNGKRHYNTRFTPSKTRSYEKEYESLKFKKDKDDYSDVKNISRQRTKLNRLLANEHERRRVAQLNSAYQSLRQLIPGYQCDTKLPKIKILRYAINYIAHLDNILETDSV